LRCGRAAKERDKEGNVMSAAERRLLSCCRLAVLTTVAVGCLAFSGVAQAAAPPDPNTVGATTLSHIELNGSLGTELTVTHGQDVKIKANWEDNNTACPDCFDNVPAAFAGNPVAGCIESQGIQSQTPSGSGEVDLGPAPNAPGTYNVVAQFEESITCGETWNASESTGYQVIARVTVPRSTCGKTTIGKTGDPLVANVKRVNKCVVPFNATLNGLTVYLTPTSFKGQEPIKGVIYADSSGKPGALVAVSEQGTFKSTLPANWYPLLFGSTVKLAAGTYWIGLITGNTGKVAGERWDTVKNAEDYNSNTYTSGPSNPFGSFKTTNEEMSLYATFEEERKQCAGIQLNTIC
jgi:hypothetical protein